MLNYGDLAGGQVGIHYPIKMDGEVRPIRVKHLTCRYTFSLCGDNITKFWPWKEVAAIAGDPQKVVWIHNGNSVISNNFYE